MAITRFNIQSLLEPIESGQTVLTPNHRSVNVILQQYAMTQNRYSAWARPTVSAIDIWIEELWNEAGTLSIEPFSDTRLLDRFSEQLIWTNLLRASAERYPLLNVEQAANSVAHSYHLYSQWLLEEDTELQEQYHAQDFQAFLLWRKQFRNYCEKHKLIGLSDATLLISRHLDALSSVLPRSILLVNFNQPPPLYAKLFSSLSEVSTVKRHPETTSVEAKASSVDFKTGKTRRHQFPDLESEVSACLDWCFDKTRHKEDIHIGIIVDHARTLESAIDREMMKKLPIEIGTFSPDPEQYFNKLVSSESLAESKLINFAMRLLALNLENLETESFCQLIQSQHIPGVEEELAARLSLQLVLRRNLAANCRLSRLRTFMIDESKEYYCPVLSEMLLNFSESNRRSSSKQMMSAWIELFTQQLQIFAWPDNKLSGSHLRDYYQWQQALNKLSSTSSIIGKIELPAALGKIRLLLSQTTQRQSFNQNLPVTVLTLEEAQDFEFDAIWLLSANDRLLPPAPTPSAYIPFLIQQKHSMPASSNKIQLDMVLLQLENLTEATRGDFVLSHHENEGDLKLRPSSLISHIALSDSSTDASAKQQIAFQQLERIEEPLHIPLDTQINSGGTSLLTNQSNCPFRAFASHRLQARKLMEFQRGLTPMIRGSALHLALEHLGKSMDKLDTLQNSSSLEKDALIAESIEPAIAMLRRQFPETMTPMFSDLERTRLAALLAAFLVFEAGRYSYNILCSEQEVNWNHSKLSLTFRIDRIDKLADGSLVLLDYKTGKKTSYKWYDDRPDDLQLPLYQLAIASETEEVVATLIYQINVDNVGLSGTTDCTQIHDGLTTLAKIRSYNGSWPELQKRWNNIIDSMVDEFEAGLVAVAPTRGSITCNYCDYQSLCRIGEQEKMLAEINETAS